MQKPWTPPCWLVNPPTWMTKHSQKGGSSQSRSQHSNALVVMILQMISPATSRTQSRLNHCPTLSKSHTHYEVNSNHPCRMKIHRHGTAPLRSPRLRSKMSLEPSSCQRARFVRTKMRRHPPSPNKVHAMCLPGEIKDHEGPLWPRRTCTMIDLLLLLGKGLKSSRIKIYIYIYMKTIRLKPSNDKELIDSSSILTIII